MDTDKRKSRIICVHLCASVACFVLGCGKPDAANIELRKQNQSLRAELDELKARREGDLARFRALESQATTVPSLTQDRLDRLFTTHGIKLGRLTGGHDSDPDRAGDEAVKVYVVPVDADGDELKA